MGSDITPPWQALGFDREELDAVAANLATTLDWWEGPPSSPDLVPQWVSDVQLGGHAAFAMRSMVYTGLRPPLDDWREIGRRIVRASVHYFLGPWRDRFTYFSEPLDHQMSRATLPWSDTYRGGLACAAALDDWGSFELIRGWLAGDVREDEGTDDRTAEDNAYQIWLAARLSGSIADHPREKVLRGRHRRPKLLMAAADSIMGGKSHDAGRALEAVLRLYREREVRPNRVDLGVAWDATVLWHVARHRGLNVRVPDELMLLIARP